MRKFFTNILLIFALGFSACTYDDTPLWDKISNHEERIFELEQKCREMNKNISALQTLVNAAQSGDYIKSVVPVTKDGEVIGYTITFAKNDPITIYHGKDGKDDADGYTPQIGVKQDTDGIYYWTLDGEWLTDEAGNKIKAVGRDGKDGEDGADGADGENGKDGADGKDGEDGNNGEDGKDGTNGIDGITPQLKIEDGYWYVSYNNGATWTKLGKATGEDGADGKDGQDGANGADGKDGQDGQDGESFFSDIIIGDNGVRFVLADGTEFFVPTAPDSLLADLDDISFIPKYTDGKATVTRYADGVILAEFDFSVAPKSIVTTIAENYESLLSINAVETATRAVTLIRMPIVSCKADANSGTISIQASGEFLNPGAFDGSVTYSAALTISDGANSVISDYIELCTFVSTENSPKEKPETPAVPDEPELPTDEKIIYYTTTDNAPVELGATTGFGGILLSNEYDAEADLGKLTFSAKVTCIPANAFKSSNISTISFPNTVTEIGDDAFYQSTISEITIPNTITKMGTRVFCDCGNLRTADINCACDIKNSCFSSCSILKNVTIGNSVTSIGSYAFERIALRSIIIPDSVTYIDSSAFQYCTTLNAVTLGNGVRSIGGCAFYNCVSLKTVTFGNSIQEVRDAAFEYCDNLQTLYINDLANYCSIDFGLDYYKRYYPTTANPVSRGAKLYLNGNLVENLVIPDGVTKIGIGAFYKCEQLKSITIPDGVTTISQKAFAYCTNITSITIPDSVTTISQEAFAYCSKIASVTVGESISSIENSAFYCCNYLQKFYCKATTTPSLGTKVFYGENGYPIGTEIYVPTEKVSEYKAATNWNSYADYIYGYDF